MKICRVAESKFYYLYERGNFTLAMKSEDRRVAELSWKAEGAHTDVPARKMGVTAVWAAEKGWSSLTISCTPELFKWQQVLFSVTLTDKASLIIDAYGLVFLP